LDPIETKDMSSDHDAIDKLSAECSSKMLSVLKELHGSKEKLE
jgi:hypothetical protein